MTYALYDKDGGKVEFGDLQDKSPWCEKGAGYEEVFVQRYGERLGVTINPAKQTDKYAPDLLSVGGGRLGDLKTQNTPFFQAQTRYSIDPQYAVVFNQKDRERYRKHYPAIDIFFWVDWIAVRFLSGGKEIAVRPMSGVWSIPFEELDVLLETASLHNYQQRRDDRKGNAKSSYVISLQRGEFRQVA
jgi:hypothetical protein